VPNFFATFIRVLEAGGAARGRARRAPRRLPARLPARHAQALFENDRPSMTLTIRRVDARRSAC
jgi:hypothetical protein